MTRRRTIRSPKLNLAAPLPFCRNFCPPAAVTFALSFITAAGCLAATESLFAQEQTGNATKSADPTADLQPLVAKYCGSCHGEKEPRGDVRFPAIASKDDVVQRRALWEAALDMIELEAMPPEDALQPNAADRERLVKGLEYALFYVDCEKARDPGRVTIRRLNRSEYNNTVRDLLGVKLRPADNFPSDDVGEGFDNIGDVLSLPPLLLEKYVDAAEALAEATIVDVTPTQKKLFGRQLRSEGGVRMGQTGVFSLFSRGSVSGRVDFSRTGRYRIRVEAGADQAGDELARLELKLDGKSLKSFEVKASPRDMEVLELETQVTGGQHRLRADFTNDYYNPRAKNRRDRDRNLYVGFLEVVGPLEVPADDLPESHRRFVSVRPGEGRSVAQAAAVVLKPILQRAFRRPARPGEMDRYVRLVELAVERGDSYERGLQVAVSAILVSPHFLFRVEDHPAPDDANKTHSLNDYELASRLSYFLWSSMPDDALFGVAASGRLHEPAVLESQVRRMLNSPKSRALVENFGGQWLNLRSLDELSPDPTQFPQFDEELRAAMREETLLFFEAIVREDRSILDFLEGDFTFVNDRLARHYGLPSQKDGKFQRVKVDTRQRRGIITHASILTLTSNPTRTSPVKRGKWILENVLGTPPPEPPANVPELDETQKSAPNATLREQLEIHRSDPSCAVCHRKMDALGFGLENFDAIGRWREQDAGKPVDASGELPGGKRFSGPGQLARLLAGEKEDFTRALVGKLLTYALGRGLEYYDRCAVDRIMKRLAQSDYRFSVLVSEVVKSEPFRLRRGEGEQ